GCRDQTARLWDVASGQQIGEPLKHFGHVNSVLFSPDGKTVLTEHGSKVSIWDVETRELQGEPLENHGGLKAIAISPDGKSLVTGCFNKTGYLWDLTTG
ncbi:MAG TPA: hypothetical protein DCM07_16225, partial [Planctomycetaceae bacterium]|nr:hypothetical protein [Planctomycetaceae bacterium]